jgi:AraC-like DNA-binding protein
VGDLNNIDIGWRSALMFAVCLPMVVAAAMLLARRVERRANAFLAAFLLIVVTAQVPQIIGFAGFYAVWPGLTFAPFSVELYAGPLLYLHACSLMVGGPLAWRRWLLLPGMLQTLYYTWAFTALGDYRAKWDYAASVHVPYVEPVETTLGLALLLFAMVAIFRLISRYRRFLGDTQSAAADFEPAWLTRLMAAMVLAGLLFAALKLAPLLIGPVSYASEYPVQVMLTAIVAWLGFQALAQTTVAFPKLAAPGEPAEPAAEKAAAEKDWAKAGAALREAVVDGGWHLEPRLTIRDVASRMATNETYVSRAVNRGLGVTFNGFINGLRVAHALALIREGRQPLLDIAAAAGFNSKATFNRVFRDLAGQTPSQFKKSQKP